MFVSGKLIGATVAGAATTIVVWALATFAHVDVPGDVAAALTTLLAAAAAFVVRHELRRDQEPERPPAPPPAPAPPTRRV